MLPFGEVGSVAQLNRVSKGLRPVPIRTLAALGLYYFGNTIIIVREALAEAADSGMRALAIFAAWIWQLRRKDSHHNPSVKALGVLFRVWPYPRVRSAARHEHAGPPTACAKSSRKNATLSSSGQHMRPSSPVASTLPPRSSWRALERASCGTN